MGCLPYKFHETSNCPSKIQISNCQKFKPYFMADLKERPFQSKWFSTPTITNFKVFPQERVPWRIFEVHGLTRYYHYLWSKVTVLVWHKSLIIDAQFILLHKRYKYSWFKNGLMKSSYCNKHVKIQPQSLKINSLLNSESP